jgi:hypothetical protein
MLNFAWDDPNRVQRYDYRHHIFPEITQAHIEERIKRFQHALARFQHIRVKPLQHNIFEISPN